MPAAPNGKLTSTRPSVRAVGGGVVTVVFLIFVAYSLWNVFSRDVATFADVAVLILVDLAAFIAIMNILSFTAQWIGIADPAQPFGLPEGTVRAILTIAFIVVVGVLSSYLLTSTGGRSVYEKNAMTLGSGLQLEAAQALVKQNAGAGLLLITPHDGPPPGPGAPPGGGGPGGGGGAGGGGPDGGAAAQLYDVKFWPKADFQLSDDVSKQTLTMLSTMLAAMIGFYFGAKPGDSAVAKPITGGETPILDQGQGTGGAAVQPPQTGTVSATATPIGGGTKTPANPQPATHPPGGTGDPDAPVVDAAAQPQRPLEAEAESEEEEEPKQRPVEAATAAY